MDGCPWAADAVADVMRHGVSLLQATQRWKELGPHGFYLPSSRGNQFMTDLKLFLGASKSAHLYPSSKVLLALMAILPEPLHKLRSKYLNAARAWQAQVISPLLQGGYAISTMPLFQVRGWRLLGPIAVSFKHPGHGVGNIRPLTRIMASSFINDRLVFTGKAGDKPGDFATALPMFRRALDEQVSADDPLCQIIKGALLSLVVHVGSDLAAALETSDVMLASFFREVCASSQRHRSELTSVTQVKDRPFISSIIRLSSRLWRGRHQSKVSTLLKVRARRRCRDRTFADCTL